MKVLVIANTAGILTPVAKWMNHNGHEVRIIQRRAFEDFGLTEESGCAIMVDSPKDLYDEIRRQVKTLKPDVIHVNSIIKGLLVARLFASSTPIVFTYCGSDLRRRGEVHPEVTLADLVTVASPDLEDYGLWVDRPLDDMFYYSGGRRERTALAVYADYWLSDTRPIMQEWCDARDIELTLLDRTSPDFEPVPHDTMPEYLSTFEYFLDFKGHGKELYALSRTAIEAIACGCKVVHDSNFDHEIREYAFVLPRDYLTLYSSLAPPSRGTRLRRYARLAKSLVRWRLGGLEK